MRQVSAEWLGGTTARLSILFARVTEEAVRHGSGARVRVVRQLVRSTVLSLWAECVWRQSVWRQSVWRQSVCGLSV